MATGWCLGGPRHRSLLWVQTATSLDHSQPHEESLGLAVRVSCCCGSRGGGQSVSWDRAPGGQHWAHRPDLLWPLFQRASTGTAVSDTATGAAQVGRGWLRGYRGPPCGRGSWGGLLRRRGVRGRSSPPAFPIRKHVLSASACRLLQLATPSGSPKTASKTTISSPLRRGEQGACARASRRPAQALFSRAARGSADAPDCRLWASPSLLQLCTQQRRLRSEALPAVDPRGTRHSGPRGEQWTHTPTVSGARRRRLGAPVAPLPLGMGLAVAVATLARLQVPQGGERGP